MSFLPFFMHPAVVTTENPGIHVIKANNVLMLSFVLETEDPEVIVISFS